MSPWYYSQLESLALAFDFSLDVPVKDMEKQDLDRVLYGTKRKRIDVQHHTRRGKTYRWRTAFEGVINNLERRYKDTESDHVRSEIERYNVVESVQRVRGGEAEAGGAGSYGVRHQHYGCDEQVYRAGERVDCGDWRG